MQGLGSVSQCGAGSSQRVCGGAQHTTGHLTLGSDAGLAFISWDSGDSSELLMAAGNIVLSQPVPGLSAIFLLFL